MLENYKVILASTSPRRRELLKGLELNFECASPLTDDESYPDTLLGGEIPMYIATKKADSMLPKMDDNTIVIAADTIAWFDGKVYGKPKDRAEAIQMLKDFSGNTHAVFTGCCLRTKEKSHPFYAVSYVTFARLKDEEIEYYVDHYKPFDKAGAYGVQEWIGYIGVVSIEGSFYNIMGLPLQRLYTEINKFIGK